MYPAFSQPPAKPEPYAMTRDREEAPTPTQREISTVIRFALSPDPDNVIKNEADLALVDKVIKYYLFRLTWEEVQKERDPSKGTIDAIMTEVIGHVETNPRLLPRYFTGSAADQDMASQRERQFKNVQAMTPVFIRNCKVLLQNKLPIVRINAVRVLAKLAEWGQEAVVDEFTAIINHPNERSAVKHYAFIGLQNILNLVGQNDIKARGLFQSKESQTRLHDVLMATYQWLNEYTKLPESRMQYMKPEEQAGIRYVRRAAMLALGASRRALVVDDRQTNKQEGPIAEILNRILAAEADVVPPPDLRERLDAVHALARIRTENNPSYLPDYTAYNIGAFLTVLGTEANAQRAGSATTFAWSLEAEKLRASLDGFAKQPMPPPSQVYVNKLAEKVKPLLEFFNDFNVNTDSVRGLSEFMRDNRPPNDKVIKPLGEK
ncbi:MAG TPA: hypothetical protein PKD72_00160 [Gemmatales bacterium]|nr:hypothetical protein [Gemmatales bacterium]